MLPIKQKQKQKINYFHENKIKLTNKKRIASNEERVHHQNLDICNVNGFGFPKWTHISHFYLKK